MPPTPPTDPWLPIHSRIRPTTVIAAYDPAAHQIRVSRRWHGEERVDSARLPPRDPAATDWVEIYGETHRFRLCWYHPGRHQMKRGYKHRGAYIEEKIPLPSAAAATPGCTPLTDDL